MRRGSATRGCVAAVRSVCRERLPKAGLSGADEVGGACAVGTAEGVAGAERPAAATRAATRGGQGGGRGAHRRGEQHRRAVAEPSGESLVAEGNGEVEFLGGAFARCGPGKFWSQSGDGGWLPCGESSKQSRGGNSMFFTRWHRRDGTGLQRAPLTHCISSMPSIPRGSARSAASGES